MADDDIVAEARKRLDAAWVHDRNNREEAFLDLKFLAGDQWPETIRQSREAANRPCLTINRLPQFVNQVANEVRKNPPGIKVIPAGGEATQELADIYTGLFRQIQARSNATHVFCQAAYYAVACGIGHFRVTTEYADDDSFEQEIFIRRIQHPMSVLWDPDAIEPGRSDAQWCLVSELMSSGAFKARFPAAVQSGFDTPTDSGAETGLFWAANEGVRVCEYWRKVPVTRTLGRTAAGGTVDLTGVSQQSRAGLGIVAERKVSSHKVERYLLSGAEILEGPDAWAGGFIPIFPVIGSEVALETATVRHGLVRFARDPQQLYNYARSAAAEVIGQQPRAPFLATPSMIAKFKGQWDTHNVTARPYLLYEPDPEVPGGRPMREPPPAMPRGFMEEAAIADTEMKATTGIYDASLGARSNEISGKAILAREAQGSTSTLHYQDNLVATLHHLGRCLIELVPKIYDSQRIIRVLDEDGETQKPVHINVAVMSVDGKPMLLNDLSQGVYDVRPKIGPAYQTRRTEAADSMLQFIQAVPQAAQVIGDLVAKSMDWPGAEAIAERLQKLLPPQISETPPPPEMQQQQAMQQQIAQGMAQAKISETQGRAAKSHAEAQRAQLETQLLAAGQGQGQQPEPQPDPRIAMAKQMQEGQQGQLKNALLAASLDERRARAAKTAVDLQGGMLKNEIMRARQGAGGGFPSNL